MANNKGLFRDVIVVAIPVASISIASSIEFMAFKKESSNFFYLSFLIFLVFLFADSLFMIAKYASLPSGKVLVGNDFDRASFHVVMILVSAFLLEALLAIAIETSTIGASGQRGTSPAQPSNGPGSLSTP